MVIEQVEVVVEVIAMAMPVPTAHTMMPKRRLDEVRTLTMLFAQNLPSIVPSAQQAKLLIYLGFTLSFLPLAIISLYCCVTNALKQRDHCIL